MSSKTLFLNILLLPGLGIRKCPYGFEAYTSPQGSRNKNEMMLKCGLNTTSIERPLDIVKGPEMGTVGRRKRI